MWIHLTFCEFTWLENLLDFLWIHLTFLGIHLTWLDLKIYLTFWEFTWLLWIHLTFVDSLDFCGFTWLLWIHLTFVDSLDFCGFTWLLWIKLTWKFTWLWKIYSQFSKNTRISHQKNKNTRKKEKLQRIVWKIRTYQNECNFFCSCSPIQMSVGKK